MGEHKLDSFARSRELGQSKRLILHGRELSEEETAKYRKAETESNRRYVDREWEKMWKEQEK